MAGADLVDAIERSLSPQMTARGFAPGQPGWSPDGSASFLFCIAAREFATRHPSTFDLLRTRIEVELDEPGRCLDFVVEASSSGEVERVDFEFVHLDALLRVAGLDDLARRCGIEELRKLGGGEIVATITESVGFLMPIEPER